METLFDSSSKVGSSIKIKTEFLSIRVIVSQLGEQKYFVYLKVVVYGCHHNLNNSHPVCPMQYLKK
jgi:hypothetical protein